VTKITLFWISLSYNGYRQHCSDLSSPTNPITQWKGQAVMNWLGSNPKHAREMDLDDIFRSRIQLLVLMATNFLRGVPLGEYQRRAMEDNARHIETECDAFGAPADWQKIINQSDDASYLYHRLRLLSKMVIAVARGVSISDDRKQDLQDNLTAIDNLIGCNAWKRNAISLRMLRLFG
jgi:hypothetical protein